MNKERAYFSVERLTAFLEIVHGVPIVAIVTHHFLKCRNVIGLNKYAPSSS